MSLPAITNVVSLTSFKPNKSDSSTKSNQVEALKLVEKAPGCKGVKFEGVAREEPDVSVRCIEWDSADAHSSYKSGATEYNKKIEAATSEVVYSVHYNLYDDLKTSLAADPKCIEYVVYNLKSADQFPAFYRAWSKCLEGVEACPGCCKISLGQQIENPTGVVQIQPWMTLEDHLPGFRGRSDLEEIMAPFQSVVQEFVEGGWGGMKAYHLLLTAPGEAL